MELLVIFVVVWIILILQIAQHQRIRSQKIFIYTTPANVVKIVADEGTNGDVNGSEPYVWLSRRGEYSDWILVMFELDLGRYCLREYEQSPGSWQVIRRTGEFADMPVMIPARSEFASG